MKETTNNTDTLYAYDPTGVITTKSNNVVKRYIKDTHGNITTITRNNSVFGTYDYIALGNQLEASDTTDPFQYCNEYYDNEIGLTFLRNRYYTSATSRFLTEAQVKDGMNWYVYCSGNLVNAWDVKLNIRLEEEFGIVYPQEIGKVWVDSYILTP